jgi:nitroreductase
VLGLPDDFDAAIGISFGYPAPAASMREPSPRLPIEELVHYERW